MKPIAIYRVEDPVSGNGIFRARDADKVGLLEKHSRHDVICDRHMGVGFPNYWDDVVLYESIPSEEHKNYHYGVRDRKRLLESFTRAELKECIAIGFKIYILTVTDYVKSPFQVMFKKSSIIHTLDVSHFFSR